MKVIECARDHADCAGFQECLTYPYADVDCEDAGPGGRCDGDRLVGCLYVGGAKTMVTECPLLGMTCVEGGPEPQCATGVACTDGDPVTCDAENRVVICQRGVQVLMPCAPGMVCTPDAAPYCVGVGEACAQPGMRRCTPEGNVATCYPVPGDPGQGRERVIDCVAQHAVCDAEDFRCVPTATACVGGENDTCLDDGSGFTGCANGEVITVPCARLGRTTCTYNRGGAGCE